MFKKKVKKKAGKQEFGKIKLDEQVPDYPKYKIKKNTEVPRTRSGPSYWDHFIDRLDKGDSVEMNKKESHSLANRARNLGFVAVLRKQGHDSYIVWFGGKKK